MIINYYRTVDFFYLKYLRGVMQVIKTKYSAIRMFSILSVGIFYEDIYLLPCT